MKREILKKSIVFRIVSITVMAAFFYFYTGSVKQMTLLTALVETIKTIQYALFEIFWKRYKKRVKKHEK